MPEKWIPLPSLEPALRVTVPFLVVAEMEVLAFVPDFYGRLVVRMVPDVNEHGFIDLFFRHFEE